MLTMEGAQMNSGRQAICSERMRRVPVQFSWVDQRLVRDRHLDRLDAYAAALYLFLITVADAQGAELVWRFADGAATIDRLGAAAARTWRSGACRPARLRQATVSS